MREGLKIVAMAVAAAIGYGVLHDQVTARVCVEYFTVGHPPVFDTTDPTLLALGWGVIATWWVGLILGVPLALAARRGPWPQRTASELRRPIGVLLVSMGISALVAGAAGFQAGQAEIAVLQEPIASQVPAAAHAAYIADLWAHSASYGVGFLGGAFVLLHVLVGRKRSASLAPRAAAADPPADASPPDEVLHGAERALTLASQLVWLPQVVLLYFSAVYGLATVVNATTQRLFALRLLSGVLALAIIVLGLLAWKRQRRPERVVTALLMLPALLLCLACFDIILRLL